MEVKTFEIRDEATFIPVLAVKLRPGCEADRYLLGRAGYGTTPERQAEYVFLMKIGGGEGRATSDPYGWGGAARTMPVAHQYIIEHWSELASGAVIDVEYIAGLRAEPKKSERLEDWTRDDARHDEADRRFDQQREDALGDRLAKQDKEDRLTEGT